MAYLTLTRLAFAADFPCVVLLVAGCGGITPTSRVDASAPHGDSSSSRPDAGTRDTSALDAGAVEEAGSLFTATLPACVYPAASVNPANRLDGSAATWQVARTFLVCGRGCTSSTAQDCNSYCGSSGDAMCLGQTSCLLGCGPTDYAVFWEDDQSGPNASPTSCTGLAPDVSQALENLDEYPRVICCPCG